MPNIALSCEIGSGAGDGQCEDAIFNEAIERAEQLPRKSMSRILRE
jgi:hypothetical protein